MIRFKGKHRRRGCGIIVLPLVGVFGAFVAATGAAVARILG